MSIPFLDKNTIDPDEINMTDIYRLPLTAGLIFIGFKVFGNFYRFFKFCIFSAFAAKNAPLN